MISQIVLKLDSCGTSFEASDVFFILVPVPSLYVRQFQSYKLRSQIFSKIEQVLIFCRKGQKVSFF